METKKQQIFNACIYVRLSHEDTQQENNSIENQKQILREYVKKHSNIKLTSVRVDDGYSGTNFNRPAFKSMIEDVEQGFIDCVVVKDLSRFGRNHIEVGRYLEQIFPKLGVRFISINDNFDTWGNDNSSQNDMITFNNIINEVYAKDISYKTRSSLEIKRKNRELIPSSLPYGYEKIDNKIVVVEEVRLIVINIFKMKIQGYNQQQIANNLNDNNILSPSNFKKSRLKNYNSEDRVLWTSKTIKRMLENEFYIGTLELGKTSSDDWFKKTKKYKSKEDWVITKDNHPNIISKNDFYTVQNLLSYDTRVMLKTQSVSLFSGILNCGDCGSTLIINNVQKKSKTYEYYICSKYKQDKSCTSHRISFKDLENAIKSNIKDYIKEYQALNNVINNIDIVEFNNTKKIKLKQQQADLKKKLTKTQKIKSSLKDKLNQDIITKKDFIDMSIIYDSKLDVINTELTKITKEIGELTKLNDDFSCFINYLNENRTIQKLNRQLLLTLIDSVVINDDKSIIIKYKFELPTNKGVL